MDIKQINIGIDTIGKIYHIADVHIRNLKRHEEYKSVFERTANYIKDTINSNDIIYLAGDIVHAKTDMSPELIQEVQEFFKSMADIAPTILITGNHDCNLNNKSRLDALTPIVNALNHPNLIYLKDSGVYKIGNVHFTVMSVLDKPADYIKANSFQADYKIALHHGSVDRAVTDIGFYITNDHVKIDIFDGYNLTLLGDIHKMQYLNKDKTIAFAGSLIQQNHSEGLSHGLLVWDLKSSSSEFIEIPNSYCFYTLDIDQGNYKPYDNLPLNVRLRVRVKDTDSSVANNIIADFKTKYNVIELAVQKTNNLAHKRTTGTRINIGDIRDIEHQNKLIYDYLKQKFDLQDTFLDGVRHINRKTNSSLMASDVNRNVVWIPKKFEFSNMFSYGKNNSVDFTNMKGTYGIFAPNASGKSSLLEALCFCIFDKCPRAFKAINVLNNKCDTFECKLQFEIDGIDYFIEKNGVKNKSGHVKVDIDFYYFDEFNQKVSLNGQERSETNNNIRKFVGTYEDFILTSMSVQNNNTAFIEMNQKDRKDLLAQFLDINIFEQLHDIANEESKDISVLIKDYKRTDFTSIIANHEREIQDLTAKLSDLESKKDIVDKEIDKLDISIVQQTSLLKPIDTSIVDIHVSKKRQIELQTALTESERSLNDITKKSDDIRNEINSLTGSLSIYDKDLLETKIKERDKVINELSSLKEEFGTLSTIYKQQLEKLSKLDQLEYDPNCTYCMNNIFVKDAIATKELVEQTKHQIDLLQNNINDVTSKVEKLNKYSADYRAYISIVDIITKKNILLNSLSKDTSLIKDSYITIQDKLKDIERAIDLYNQNEESISYNKSIQEEIDLLQSKKRQAQNVNSELNKQIIQSNGLIQVHESNKQSAQESIKKLSELELEYKYYQHYLEAVNRDGVPYHLISLALPQIEQEINNILIPLVDFVIKLDSDGKNINAYIVYDIDNFWPIELTSGMERFLSSLAIRSALISVSSLPRPNFIAIDEGFGTLDSDKLTSIYSLFDYLKTQFRFLLIISHIDSMKDIADKLIEINKTNNFSNINYT